MGLDMYLEKKISVRPDTSVDMAKVSYVALEAGYWRKANAIHRWFVENVQDGQDDCREYYVSRDQLKELLDIVNTVLDASELVDGDVVNGYKIDKTGKHPMIEQGKVIKDPSVAEELLPTASGFFFGSTEYNQYYIEDLKLTKQIVEEALADEEGQYYYASSW